MQYFDELADAVEATPAAKTARIYAALTAVRTILLHEVNHDTYSARSGDDRSMLHTDDEDADVEDASGDHTCESEADSPQEQRAARTRSARLQRSIPHYNMGKDSDLEQPRNTGPPSRGRRRTSRSRSTSPRNRSKSPTIAA